MERVLRAEGPSCSYEGEHAADSGGPTAREWLKKFLDGYDEAVADPVTELGLFYERHRNYVRYEWRLDQQRVEYSDDERRQALAELLGRLAREYGYYQLTDWNGRPDVAWLSPTSTWQLALLVTQANNVDETIGGSALSAAVNSRAALSVLIIYPDYPLPEGASTLEEATSTWRSHIEQALQKSPPDGEFVLLTISANSWELPSTWVGFVWDGSERTLRPVGR